MKSGLQRLMDIQDATVSLERMLGSSAAAADLTAKALAVVKGTPFPFPDFAQATRTLVAYGVAAGRVPGGAQAIADSAAASGAGRGGCRGPDGRVREAPGPGQAVSSDILESFGTAGVNGLALVANHFGITTESAEDDLGRPGPGRRRNGHPDEGHRGGLARHRGRLQRPRGGRAGARADHLRLARQRQGGVRAHGRLLAEALREGLPGRPEQGCHPAPGQDGERGPEALPEARGHGRPPEAHGRLHCAHRQGGAHLHRDRSPDGGARRRLPPCLRRHEGVGHLGAVPPAGRGVQESAEPDRPGAGVVRGPPDGAVPAGGGRQGARAGPPADGPAARRRRCGDRRRAGARPRRPDDGARPAPARHREGRRRARARLRGRPADPDRHDKHPGPGGLFDRRHLRLPARPRSSPRSPRSWR
jgi:hypothetical protein